ncbi:thioredoxin domain-containing protein [Novosphingobium sp.]|uniref:thioredoxin domain-containing protein n=1 Tax=Novosphingobium sp. TaxID=1874826 RepID=UPI00333E68BE
MPNMRNRLTALIAAGVLAVAMIMGIPASQARPAPRVTPAAHPTASPAQSAKTPNWNATVTRTPDEGYMLGNPDAPLHLVAYLSYTCPHCADFEAEADAQLRLGMIAPGKGTYEIRPFLRNGLDLAAALLAECGATSKFFGNTQALLAGQRTWMAPVGALTEAQKGRWESPDFGTKMRAIASDLHLYDLMERRGYTRAEMDRCLSDKARADRLAKRTAAATEKDFINGTPGFLINGVTLTGTYSWEVLKPQIDARLR